MANLGNAWHIPTNPEPQGRAGMRDPIGALVPGMAATIFSGNQYQGAGGNPGNQLQDGSTVFFRKAGTPVWSQIPMLFQSAQDNNKYYAATIPAGAFAKGDTVQYFLQIPYSDHATTFVMAAGAVSGTTDSQTTAEASPFTFVMDDPAVRGEWGPVFPLPNVGIHSHVLPSGKVLLWGRRDQPDQSLDVHACTPFIWDPATRATTNTPQPKLANGTTINLFCSGHTFLNDGRLLVTGGHLADSQGLNQACIYDWKTNTWTPTAVMNNGRWYPTSTTLGDGSVLVASGSFMANNQIINNPVPQIWTGGTWRAVATLPGGGPQSFALFPRLHLTPGGKVFMSGPLAQSWLFDPAGAGSWTKLGTREGAQRDYAPSVMYDAGKVIYIGGGNDGPNQAPSADAEIIDLTVANPAWSGVAPMHFRRRQHNATILPDGTVLVTGGTQGGGGPGGRGFNDLDPGEPVHTAELWDPATKAWTELTAEQVDRCYHATTVLLPDGTVLSAGGGEYRPTQADIPNDPIDSHRDAQIYSPPYLFKGQRPTISAAPAMVNHGDTFTVGTPDAADIAKVSIVRLSSVTHSFNMDQHINFLAFKATGTGLSVTAPATPGECPPGFYLLFILSKAGVPSVGSMLQVNWSAKTMPKAAPATKAARAAAVPEAPLRDAFAVQTSVLATTSGPKVVVGLLGTCPYGIGACWGGAHEALAALSGVQAVDPIPDSTASTADVYLFPGTLPDLPAWTTQFTAIVNGSYELRGVEMSVTGTVARQGSGLVLAATPDRPAVTLVPLVAGDKVQWDARADAPQAATSEEAHAWATLEGEIANLPEGAQVTVTGPLRSTGSGAGLAYTLEVRTFTT